LFPERIASTFEWSKKHRMKALLPISVSILLIAASCAESGEKKIISVEKKIVMKQPVKVNVNREMSINVEGMSCEHACGGAIRMALKETGAVDRCSFDFETDRKVNTAFITFDKDKISPDKIVSIIEKVNDGQFTTSNATTKPVEDKTTGSPEKTEKTTEVVMTKKVAVDLDIESSSFQLPDIRDFFSKLID
jgi:copper chaperone CopZ